LTLPLRRAVLRGKQPVERPKKEKQTYEQWQNKKQNGKFVKRGGGDV